MCLCCAAGPDPVTEEAPLAGFVTKTGMTAVANWHPAYAPLRIMQFNTWLGQKGSVLNGTSPASMSLMGTKPPFVLPSHAGLGCKVYYNER
jgi:hypothetical protein